MANFGQFVPANEALRLETGSINVELCWEPRLP